MPQIKSPMLAQPFDLEKHGNLFPLAVTPKIDGIRCLKINGQFVSRSFKQIRNDHIQKVLQSLNLPDGVDGELVCEDNFQSTTSGVMSKNGSPDFIYYIFDYVDSTEETLFPYFERIQQLSLRAPKASKHIRLLLPDVVYSLKDLYSYQDSLDAKYEGVILRSPNSLYEFKRSKNLLKVKKFEDAEAIVIDFNEKLINQNPQTLDKFGYSKRSSSKSGLISANTLGSLVVRDSEGREFKIGSGFDDNLRQEIWNNKELYVGKLAKYKFMPHGIKSLPRHPVFLGFRHPDDL